MTARGEIARQGFFACALFVTALWLYTRQNNFPFYYHPDEPSKVAQIQDGSRNFHHPLLLLTATDLTRRFTNANLSCQEVVQVGRWWSAIFAATAVAAFSWLGFNRFGLRGGIAAGLIMLLQRRPYELSHFMKEDCALLAGIALGLVAIDAFWRRPSMLRAFLLGAATALAASGKYIGLFMLLPALAVVTARRDALPITRALSAFVLAFLLVAAAINFPAVLHPSALTAGVIDEITHLNTRFGVEAQYSAFGWVRYFLETSLALLLFMLAYVGHAFARFRRKPLPDLLLAAFPFAFGLLLSFSVKQGGRYMLPVTEVAALLGTFGALHLWKEWQSRGWLLSSRLVAVLLLCSALYDLGRTVRLARGFRRDHRAELVQWIKENVPPDAIVAVEERVGIPAKIPADRPQRFCELPSPLPQKLLTATFASDLGSFDEMRARGVTHLAVSEGRYYLFFENGRSARRGSETLFETRRTFYRRLFAEGRLVWSREAGTVGVLNPVLRLYDIRAPALAPSP